MITWVKLKNWRSHLESEFNFSSGTNALLGSMGSGKTSCLDSICFALFGTFPTLQTKKLKLDDVIMKKPIEKNRAEVEVHFQANSTTYSVKRIIEKGKGTSYSEIREDGKLLEAPNSQRVTEIVEKILKVNYDLFSKAVYSEQNALDYFLTIPRGQRMKKIDELLMMDRFEKARASTVTLTNKIAERKLAKQSLIDQIDLDTLQKNISELKISLDSLIAEKQLFQKNLEEVTLEKVKLEKEVSELKKIREELEVLKREEKGISSVIQETLTILEKFEKGLKGLDKQSVEKDLKNLSKLTKDLEIMVRERQKDYQKLQEKVSKSKAEVELLKTERIERLEKELNEKLRIKNRIESLKKIVGEDTEAKFKEKKELLEKIVHEIESTKIRIEDLQSIITQLSSLEGKCPVCESKLTKAKKKFLIKQKESEIKKLKENLKKVGKQKQLSEKELKELEEATDKLEKMLIEIKDIDAIQTELENSKNIFLVVSESSIKLDNELSNVRIELENLQEKLKGITDEKQKFEILLLQLREYEDRKNRIDVLFKQREEILKHVAETDSKISRKGLEKQEFELMNLTVKEKEIATKIVGLDQIFKEKEARLKDLEQTIANTLKEKEEIVKLEKLIKDLKIFEKALEATQIELRREFVTAVNYTMNHLWGTLYPYQDFAGIGITIEEGDYILQLQDRMGKFVNAEGIASGGERSIACLALRIAFSLVLAPQLRMLILDEPTANLDAKAITELATTLRERINEFIDQTFLITHQAELEDAVTGSAYRLERDKAKDDVTRAIVLT